MKIECLKGAVLVDDEIVLNAGEEPVEGRKVGSASLELRKRTDGVFAVTVDKATTLRRYNEQPSVWRVSEDMNGQYLAPNGEVVDAAYEEITVEPGTEMTFSVVEGNAVTVQEVVLDKEERA